jgi:hypothetical protein
VTGTTVAVPCERSTHTAMRKSVIGPAAKLAVREPRPPPPPPHVAQGDRVTVAWECKNANARWLALGPHYSNAE